MKKYFFITVLSALALCAIPLACSPTEEKQAANDAPILAPTTRAMESIQQKIDPIAQKAEQGAIVVQHAAQDAAGIGIPGAGLVALIASLIGTTLGAYNERRKGTVPLQSALTQIVQSVEAAFPQKSEEQKSTLAALQDQSTKRLVSIVKGS